LFCEALLELRKILSNKIGFPNLSKTVILHQALNHGSIAKIFFQYSGLVRSKAPKFELNDFIASSSHISFNIHLTSFSTDLNKVLYHREKASSNSGIKILITPPPTGTPLGKGRLFNISLYLLFNRPNISSDFSSLIFNIFKFSHLFNARI